MNNKNKNWNCDNEHCTDSKGEIRVLPTGGSSNALLCHACWKHELAFRHERNKTLGKDQQFKMPNWETLEIYSVEA